MKVKVLVLALLFVSSLNAGQSGEKHRFDELQWQHNDSAIREFTTWHDNESGIEFICAQSWYVVNGYNQPRNGPSISCFTTGRSWK